MPRTPEVRRRGVRGAAVALTAAGAAAALAAPPAAAQPHDPPDAGAAAGTVEALYEQAERATDQYNAATVRVARLSARLRSAQDNAARTQQRVNTMRGALSSVVGAQYRSGGIDPSLALLLTSDPGTYLERASLLDRIRAKESGVLHSLQQAARELAQQRTAATRDLAGLRAARAGVARHKRTVQARLAGARSLLGALPAADRDPYGHASRATGRAAPDPGAAGPASARAAAAVTAARSALGRPYAWGANGPGAFDCSGLMQWAYARAGVGLPRTSQAQRYAGRRIPLSEARPGDLVAYRADAGHIAMYVGHGQVIHAPYPGATVRYDPVGMLPISSVTRV